MKAKLAGPLHDSEGRYFPADTVLDSAEFDPVEGTYPPVNEIEALVASGGAVAVPDDTEASTRQSFGQAVPGVNPSDIRHPQHPGNRGEGPVVITPEAEPEPESGSGSPTNG